MSADLNEINFEEVGALEPGHIMIDSPRQWRPDCKAGQFKIGSTTMRGPRLDMEIIAAAVQEGEFYGYPPQKWMFVMFVDPDGVLSTILFKTESLDNFAELWRCNRLKGETLLGKTINARMCKRSSRANGESYYAVEFEVTATGKFFAAIAEFRSKAYQPDMLRLASDPTTPPKQ